MKFPFRRSSTKEPVPAIEEGRLTHQLAPANGHAVQRHLAKVQRSIRLFCFVAGMFLLAVILPASPIRQALGYGGGSAFINPICGHPQQVFARLRPGATYSLPSTTELLHLPTLKQRPISDAYGQRTIHGSISSVLPMQRHLMLTLVLRPRRYHPPLHLPLLVVS